VVLDPNKGGSQDNNLTFLAGQNQDLSVLNDSLKKSDEEGGYDPERDGKTGRKRINEFGEVIDDSRGGKAGMFGIIGLPADGSEYSHNTPIPVDDSSIVFDKGDGINKPLEVDLSESFDNSENDIVVYDKEDMTNYSKGLHLNVVKQRNLPEFGMLGSETGSTTSKNKKRKITAKDRLQNKLSKISGIYESEPHNSRVNRNKAFGIVKKGGRKDKDSTFDVDGKTPRSDGDKAFGLNQKSTRSENRGDLFFSKSPHGHYRGHSKDDADFSRTLRKKLKKRKNILQKKELEDRQKKFRALDINKKYMDDKALAARKRAHKRIKSRVIDYTFYLDYESPYAEYLPARYREWQPKEPKKPENNYINVENCRIGDKLDEVSQIYKKEAISETSSIAPSRKPHQPSKKSSFNLPLPGSAYLTSSHLHPKNRLPNQFSKKRQSKSNLKSRPKLPRKPIELDNFDESLDFGSDDGKLKIFNPKKGSKLEEEKVKMVNYSMVNSEKGAHIVPPGMDIEDARYGL
jgi:hypothetical protein